MAKIVKKKRKLKLQNLLSFVFVLSLFAYLGSTFVIRSMNVSLNYQLTQLNNENKEKTKELDTLRLDVENYTNREYLMSLCAANGLELSVDNTRVTYIRNKE